MNLYKIKSYAKINLTLNVVGKLKKLHKIESIISFTNLHDLILIKKIQSSKHKVTFYGKFSKNIKKNNTVSNLLNILDKNKFLKNKKYLIRIKKNIPQEAGLGGGSMNSANILIFFIKKKIIRISQKQITKISNIIGSDVILGTKLKSSILISNGNIKRYSKCPKFHILLVKPKFGCSTKNIYSKIKKFTKPKYNQPKKFMFSTKYLLTQKNNLEEIAFNCYPKLKKIKNFLLESNNPSFVRMTGSGSVIVAYYQSKQDCENAKVKFRRKFKNYWYNISKTI